ncbi:MAG: hypothetical protein KKA44_13430 [Alphaproteobacteria bacterium]|nr:hypothetical protein [Alphaproteobacteria bacterium]MBU0864315.1 hypothetical protein [Alphaproteobacteria bacterium]MBU1825958.1 hypothetical protein [Alphaproteobacteria bacterium]
MFITTLLFAAAGVPQPDLLYTLESTTTLPSTNTDWDYAKMQPGTERLFIARGKDGLTVFDVDKNAIITTIANSSGANGPLLIPELDRGYAAMTDGSLLSFKLKSLTTIARLPLSSEGGLNSAVYDPLTKRLHAITGTGKERSTWYTLDAATGKLLGTHHFPFRKMDDPANDGKGHLFAPVRYDRLILKLNAQTLAEQARWSVPCNISKILFDAPNNRLLAACTGDEPRFLAIDAANGKIMANLPIGRGIDGFVTDPARGRIVTSNGGDANLTVIGTDGRDRYRALGSIGTRSNARMMAMDVRDGSLLVVAADSTLVAGPGEAKEVFHPDSFVVLKYAPR